MSIIFGTTFLMILEFDFCSFVLFTNVHLYKCAFKANKVMNRKSSQNEIYFHYYHGTRIIRVCISSAT